MATIGINASPVRIRVAAISTSNLTLNGPQTADTVSLTAGMLCGALGQSDNKNAVYLVQDGAWLPVNPGFGTGLEVYATGGSANVNAVYGCDTTGAITWGTTSTTFTLKAAGGAVYTPSTGIKAITAADSPYQVLSTDQVLLVDSSGGVVTLTMESAPSATRAPLAIVDAARSFATHNVTVNGNGKNIRGSATLGLARQDGGVILYYTGTDWELNASQYYTADSIQGTALQSSGLLRMLSTVGSNGAGTVTLTGAKAGDYIIGVVDITDHSSLSPTTDFTQQIAVNDQAGQLSATDLSAKTLVFLLVAKS